MDEDLYTFLKEFRELGYLNNTLLIILGDHGWRYGTFRETIQGKLEERLPLFTMTFPTWFEKKYPKLAKNLEANTKRLTSWFDLHATFNHILEYPNEPKESGHGMSLLNEVPLDRSCEDASIPSHWCPCLHWSVVDHEHNHLQRAALEAISHINDLNFKEELGAEKCSKLTLFKMNRAEIETPNVDVLRFKQSGKDGYEPIYSSVFNAKDHCRYQISFVTLPNHGMFEASVLYLNGKFFVKEGVSRINKYGDQPKCIADSLPHLRKYCHCKS